VHHAAARREARAASSFDLCRDQADKDAGKRIYCVVRGARFGRDPRVSTMQTLPTIDAPGNR